MLPFADSRMTKNLLCFEKSASDLLFILLFSKIPIPMPNDSWQKTTDLYSMERFKGSYQPNNSHEYLCQKSISCIDNIVFDIMHGVRPVAIDSGIWGG